MTTQTITTQTALDDVAFERAPRSAGSFVNSRIVCADGYAISVQASERHYATDSHPSGRPAYWRMDDSSPVHPFTAFEVGWPSDSPAPAEVWDEYESGGIWAWVPRQVVADLLDAHGGAVSWERR